MLFKITNGAVSFGAETVLERIDFEIDAHKKIALVGRNGCGKSTLLKAIVGSVDLEEGTGEERLSVMRPGAKSIGYLRQSSFENENATLGEEVLKAYKPLLDLEKEKNDLSKKLESSQNDNDILKFTQLEEQFVLLGGYYFRKEYESAIKNFGFTEADKSKRLCEFSGGQRTKIAFLRLLLEKPEILLLDEPTNHLDVTALLWLEDYLASYKNSIVVVSHDRMFLDKIADEVYEIEYGVTTRYKGNYTEFLRQKRVNYEKAVKDYEAQQKEIARLTRVIERFKNKPTKVAMTRSKLKQIEHMVKLQAPDRYDLTTFKANFNIEKETVDNVLNVTNLSIGYNNEALATISLNLKRGMKLGIIGGNGLGKSTFLKTLVGKLNKISGDFQFGLHSKIGYFDQQMALYSSSKTVFDDFYDEFPTLNETEVRSALGAFQFTGDDVFKFVNMLSGGERVRLALCKIFKEKPNVLILDEPTNHMDIVGKDTLERMLAEYKGTVIFVSHDRYFVNKLADCLLVFENNTAEFLPYTYSEYLEKRKDTVLFSEDSTTKPLETKIKNGNILRERKKKEERDRRKKEKLESDISNLEQEIAKLNLELNNTDNSSDYEMLSDIQSNISELEDKLLCLMEEWDNI